MIKNIKPALVRRLPLLVLVLTIMQPLLDVLSFFLGEMGSNALSTLLRMALLATVALLGFITSDRKKLYILFYGAGAVFWALHVANCTRIGYQSVVQDTANFLRIISFLVFTLSLITFFRQRGEAVAKSMLLGCGINYILFWVFTLLPWAIGQPQYTYEKLFVGLMGWFSIPNAQSTILVMAAPFAVFWAYRTQKYPVFLAMCLLCFGLMFATGTKLTFYSIFIIAGAYLFLFALQLGKKSIKYVAALLLIILLAFVFRHQAPMYLREAMSATSRGLYNQQVEESLKKSGTDKKTIETAQKKAQQSSTSNKKVVQEKTMEEIHRGLIHVYTDTSAYGEFLYDMNQRFGVYRVMEAYNYSTSSTKLSDFRLMKGLFSQLVWEEKDFCTRLLGYEYNEFLVGDTIYDLENDFPAIYYFFGYIGFTLYLLFFLYIAFGVLRAFFQDMAAAFRALPARPPEWWRCALWALGGAWQGLRRFLTVEMGAAGMSFLLAIIAGQISGYVLRRPNVTIYFAMAAAYLFYLAIGQRQRKRWTHDA